MLRRHLLEKSVRIGVGANRAATAASFIGKNGCFDPRSSICSESPDQSLRSHSHTKAIGAIILDDGMQVYKFLSRVIAERSMPKCVKFQSPLRVNDMLMSKVLRIYIYTHDWDTGKITF